MIYGNGSLLVLDPNQDWIVNQYQKAIRFFKRTS